MGGILYEDTLQQAGKHEIKHEWLSAHGVKVVRIRFDGTHEEVPISFGDYYAPNSNIVVDTKRSVDEVSSNISREHKRFRGEIKRARRDGYRLVILIENTEGITGLHDLGAWVNGHCRACRFFRMSKCDPRDLSTKCIKHNKRKPIQGEQLAKAMLTMGEKYGVRFMFCTPEKAAEIICKLLGVKYE